MAKQKSKFKIDYKKIILILIALLSIILLFYVFDYYVHSLSPDYEVPSYYFKNKIIFGLFWGLAIYYFIRKLSILKRSLLLSAFISIVLQVRYYLEGYSKTFVFEFLFFHFLMLLFASLIVFYALNKWIKSS